MKPINVKYHEFTVNRPQYCIAPTYKYYWMADVNGYTVYIYQDYQDWCKGKNLYSGAVTNHRKFHYELCRDFVQAPVPLKTLLKTIVEIINGPDERLVWPNDDTCMIPPEYDYYVKTGDEKEDKKWINSIYREKKKILDKEKKAQNEELEKIDGALKSLNELYEK